MKTLYKLFILSTVLLSTTYNYAQIEKTSFYPFNEVYSVINKMNNSQFISLEEGNIWDYTEEDESGFLFSAVKKILRDTLMQNGFSYKIVETGRCANSVTDPPLIEYQRIDSIGNVHQFENGEDRLRYDFTSTIGDTFSSPWNGYYWKVKDLYQTNTNGTLLWVYELELYNELNELRYFEILLESYGLIHYQGTREGTFNYPIGDLWGAVIDSEVIGDLLACGQEIDWNDLYPLNIGDFWFYIESSGSGLDFRTTKELLKDTLMSDGFIYKEIEVITYEPFYIVSKIYERIDSLGNVFEFDQYNEGFIGPKYRLSTCVGDTFSHHIIPNAVWLLGYKYIRNIPVIEDSRESLYYQTLYIVAPITEEFTRKVGIHEYSVESTSGRLIGAVINGHLYGDTTLTSIKEMNNYNPTNIKLSQNYPNPFNPSTKISWQTPVSGQQTIKVYDVLGNEIVTLVDKYKPAGSYEVEFNADGLPSGIYFYRLSAGSYLETRKMLLLK